MADGLDSSVTAVEIVTRSYAVTGQCYGVSEHIRLIDLLNVPKMTHLQLTDAKVREFSESREVVSTKGLFLIERDSVVFGRSLESPEEEARRRETRRIDFVEKAAHRMLVFASPFRVTGNLHIIREADLSVALPRLFEGFLAITDASVVHEAASGVAWESRFIAVNGRYVEMVCPSLPANWRDQPVKAKEAGGGQGRASSETSQPDSSAA
ncbi:MAG: hypothetical protein ABSG55_04585 [Dehalococcoidia bacterium]|jgi:hypothetical protein